MAFAAFAFLVATFSAFAEERFPPPQFETGYTLPVHQQIPPRVAWWAYVDIAALLVALSVASWLALGRRSRRGMVWLSIVCLAYFGFYRQGCVCSIGSTQNVILALCDPGYAIPLVVAAFFVLPLLFALFFGRAYCSGVCPMGAMQDLVVWRPVTVPVWLEHALGLVPFIYLGAAGVFAATGSAFLVCRYDPFVSFFRLTGSMGMLLLGGAFLLVGMFVGRPYCRFFCPYGGLLRVFSRFSLWTVRISPEECVDCRLCEMSCPYGAIHHPSVGVPPRDRPAGRRKLALLILLLPVLVAASAGVVRLTGGALSRLHPTVALARGIYLEDAGKIAEPTDASKAYRNTGQSVDDLYTQASAIRQRFTTASTALGAWVGLVIGLKLITLSTRPRRSAYEADPGACVACARCFLNCPKEHERLKGAGVAPGAAPPVQVTVTGKGA